jgi:hypothetical protein
VTLEEYKQALAFKDWFYYMSDDFTTYQAGAAENFKLATAAQVLDPDFEIWKQFQPKAY